MHPARALNLSPSGAGLFVGEVNSVVHLSTQTLGSLEATIAQPGSVNAIAVSLDGSRVYAANSTQSAAQYAAEGVFASGPVLAVGPTSFRVHPVVTTNDGILTFVNSGAAATITVIDNQTQKVLRYLASEIDPSIIAVGSSTSPLFATSVSINGQIPSRLAKLSPSTGNLQREIDLSFSPSAMAVSPDNSQLWLLAINYGTVTVYDTFTLGVIGSLFGDRAIDIDVQQRWPALLHRIGTEQYTDPGCEHADLSDESHAGADAIGDILDWALA